MTKEKDSDIINWANEVLDIEAAAIFAAKRGVTVDFVAGIKILAACRGRIVVAGMGKAGIIGQKFSATLSSTGTSSFWLHAAEAVHGDLGRIREHDAVVVLSYSGETEEIKNLIPFIKKIGAKIVAVTGNPNSSLARYADSVIDARVDKEACALGLAPTTSTTVMLAVCDAICVVLMKLKGFEEKDFALFHPRGSLGRRLLLKVKDIMRRGRYNPVVAEDDIIKDVLLRITHARAGAAVVTDIDGRLIGIFTDGDLRRNLEKKKQLLKMKVGGVMTKNPIVINEDILASQAMLILEKRKIDEVPVVDAGGRPVGMLDIQDLIAAGLI